MTPRAACITFVFVGCVVATPMTHAQGRDARPPRNVWVIPPGQEPVVQAMLGGTAPIGGCTYTSARIQPEHVDVDFVCGAAQQHVRLAHRGDGPCRGQCTQTFDVSLDPSAPTALRDALLRNVAREEARFRWLAPAALPPRYPALAFARRHAAPLVGAVALFMGIVVALRRRAAP